MWELQELPNLTYIAAWMNSNVYKPRNHLKTLFFLFILSLEITKHCKNIVFVVFSVSLRTLWSQRLVCLRDLWKNKKNKKTKLLQGFVISQNRKNKKNNVFKWFGDLDYWKSFQTLRIQWFWSLSTLHNHPNHCIRKVWRLSNHSNLAWSPTAYYFNDLQLKMINFQLRINWIMSFRAPDWTRINFD